MERAAGTPGLFAELPVRLEHGLRLDRQIGRGGMAIVFAATLKDDRFDASWLLAGRDAALGLDALGGELAARAATWSERGRAAQRLACARHGIQLPSSEGGTTELAVKVLSPQLHQDAAMVLRFQDEWQGLLGIDHPHLISVHGGGMLEEPRLHYYLMDLIRSPLSVEELTELSLSARLEVVRQAALGAGALHSAGMIHRDLKPTNIAVQLTPAGVHTRVLDLGVAKRLERDLELTRTGAVIGTVRFVAPELIHGGRHATEASDIYALGATLYQLLAGEPPYSGRGGLEVLGCLAGGVGPEPPSSLAGTPPWLDDLVAEVMAPRPEDRPPTTVALARLLSRAARRLRDETRSARALEVGGASSTALETPGFERASEPSRERRRPGTVERRRRKTGATPARAPQPQETVAEVAPEPRQAPAAGPDDEPPAGGARRPATAARRARAGRQTRGASRPALAGGSADERPVAPQGRAEGARPAKASRAAGEPAAVPQCGPTRPAEVRPATGQRSRRLPRDQPALDPEALAAAEAPTATALGCELAAMPASAAEVVSSEPSGSSTRRRRRSGIGASRVQPRAAGRGGGWRVLLVLVVVAGGLGWGLAQLQPSSPPPSPPSLSAHAAVELRGLLDGQASLEEQLAACRSFLARWPDGDDASWVREQLARLQREQATRSSSSSQPEQREGLAALLERGQAGAVLAALTRPSDDIELEVLRARALLLDDRPLAAGEALERLTARAPKSGAAWLALAEVRAVTGGGGLEAEEALAQAEALGVDRARLAALRVTSLLARGALTAAEQVCLRWQEQAGGVEALRAQAAVRCAQGRPAAALALRRRAVGVAPESWRDQLGLCEALLRSGRLAEAARALAAARRLQPWPRELALSEARLALARGDWRGALETLATSRRRHARCPRLALLAARAALAGDEREQAAMALADAEKTSPALTAIERVVLRVELHARAGQPSEVASWRARLPAQRVVERGFIAARVARLAGDVPAALSAAEAACQRDPDSAVAQAELGRALQASDKRGGAVKALERALELGLGVPALRLDLAAVRLQLRHWRKAASQLEAVARVAPDSGRLLLLQLELALRRGEREAAERLAERLVAAPQHRRWAAQARRLLASEGR